MTLWAELALLLAGVLERVGARNKDGDFSVKAIRRLCVVSHSILSFTCWSIRSVRVYPVSVWVSSECFGFLPHSTDRLGQPATLNCSVHF